MIEDLKEYDSINSRAKKKLEKDMGPEVMAALNDPRTIEIMLNPDGKLWVERLGEGMQHVGSLRPAQGQAIIETIAGYHRKEVTTKYPLLEGEVPLDNSRFAGQLSPVVSGPTFAIRKKAVSIFTLQDYVDKGVMTPQQMAVIIDAVAAHKNILVVGGTSSGKTTLVNAIIYQMVMHNLFERFVIIEDTGEIQCAAENYVQYHATADISMTALLKITLRMRPDRIIVGEVRGPEALDLLMAWNSGHPGGAATLHANSAKAGLAKLLMYISMHPDSPTPIEPLIGEAVHVVVNIAKKTDGNRHIQEIIEVLGYENGQYQLKTL
ncbi:MAG: P-type conjugative transfer ATPase TrbB [Alphaproteobacteria bacterium]|jgi:type IV secretion system protein TrbB|nr:P-type conjugative transfer ATPase TrbB [Alphaproteobacteria bacterium]